MPNYESISGCHYRPVNSTPTHIDGIIRPVHDFQPRKQSSETFEKGEISLTDEASVDKFCIKSTSLGKARKTMPRTCAIT